MRLTPLLGLCILSVLSGAGGCARKQTLQRFEFTRLCMGVETRVVLYDRDPKGGRADNAARAAFAEIDRLDQVMSDYRPDSELMQLSAASGQGPQPVGADLHAVLGHAVRIAHATDGAFDPTLGPLTELWRESRRSGALPDPTRLADARARTGWRHISLGHLPRTASLQQRAMKLDLGGIGKGYAADRARAVLRSLGQPVCLVALAGDIAVGDPPPDQAGWRIAVAGADDLLLLSNTCVSTSGDAEQFVEVAGVRYAHILDPATGLGLTRPVQATVVAADGATADALDTALCVMTQDKWGPALAAFPGAHALIITPTARWESAGWSSLNKGSTTPAPR